MKKARESFPPTTQKAPKALKPVAPFERNHETPPPHRSEGARDSRRKPYSKFTKRKADQASIGGPAQSQMPVPAVFGARVNRRAADRLRAGHLWVYASGVESIETGGGDAPQFVPVEDSRGLLLGTALFSAASQIALRMVSR